MEDRPGLPDPAVPGPLGQDPRSPGAGSPVPWGRRAARPRARKRGARFLGLTLFSDCVCHLPPAASLVEASLQIQGERGNCKPAGDSFCKESGPSGLVFRKQPSSPLTNETVQCPPRPPFGGDLRRLKTNRLPADGVAGVNTSRVAWCPGRESQTPPGRVHRVFAARRGRCLDTWHHRPAS